MNRFVIISGCSGGGKSTLLAELGRRGHAIVEEPGRRIVAEELAGDMAALPWRDAAAFARRALIMARADLARARGQPGWTFFDRGLVDAAVALRHAAGTPLADSLGDDLYHPRMFLAPPWPEIFARDAARRHDLAGAISEYDRLAAAYPALGYEVVILPKASVAERAAFIFDALRS